MLLKPQSEIRKHYFLNRYVVITPGRAKRPLDVHEHSIIEKTESCVLCPAKIEKNLILDWTGNKKKWQIMVLKNKFPAFTINNPKAQGQQEVIIETPIHGQYMAELTLEHLTRILKTYVSRVKRFETDKKINYILIFKNSGSKAGASLHHSHSQTFASHLLPPKIAEKLAQFTAYQQEHDSCPYCDAIKLEIKNKSRIISNNSLITTIAPYASEYHYEAWILPKRHVVSITELTTKELVAIAEQLKLILSKLKEQQISFNFSFDYIPGNLNDHLHIKIQPRDSTWAGVEMNTGLVINSIPPEDAAKFYKFSK